MKLSSLLSLALTSHVATALPIPRRIPEILAEIKQRQTTEPVKLEAPAIEHEDVQTLFLDQKLNHFDDTASTTFRQRYFYTDRFVHKYGRERGRKAAAFLCVGGEGPSLKTDVLVDSVHCTGDMILTAVKLFNEYDWDIHLFALEHRYYGESFPYAVYPGQEDGGDGSGDDGDNSTDFSGGMFDDLTYLSSRQAVRDIQHFVRSPEVAKHLSEYSFADPNVKWITFGGSYPGMLAAWSHLIFPDVIDGAVANSAPVQPELDFTQYYDHVARDLADEAIGGSEECRRIFVEGHEQIVDVLEGRSFPHKGDGDDYDAVGFIANRFNVCDPDVLKETRRNIEILIGDGIVRVPAQENDASCEKELCNIQKLCDAIVSEARADPNKSSMDILAIINEIQLGNYCNDAVWTDYVDYFSYPTPENANDRSWLYQTCTEFGFYQTCQVDSDCPYGKGYHGVDRDLEMCQALFGISPDDVTASIESTLEYYGGWMLTPSAEAMGSAMPSSGPHLRENQDDPRILFVNGDVDPWSELSVSRLQGAPNQLIASVPGASHHFWTHKIQDSDGDAIAAARQDIYEAVIHRLLPSRTSIASVE